MKGHRFDHRSTSIDTSLRSKAGQPFPARYVGSHLLWESPDFVDLRKKIKGAPQPGFFLAPHTGDFTTRVHPFLNRHCLWSSESFVDNGQVYRDVDAKGVGYTQGFPAVFLPIQYPEMDGDRQHRGILHHDAAEDERLVSEELYRLDARVVRHVAHVELDELVEAGNRFDLSSGKTVPRKVVADRLWSNYDNIRPTLVYRAMGTNSRINHLIVNSAPEVRHYVTELIDDAIGFISEELGARMTPGDYGVWFAETLGLQLNMLHQKQVFTDLSAHIHAGTHNVTLDCRFVDVGSYSTPLSRVRETEQIRRELEEHPELAELFRKPLPSAEQRKKLRGEHRHMERTAAKIILSDIHGSLDQSYGLSVSLKSLEHRFDWAYKLS